MAEPIGSGEQASLLNCRVSALEFSYVRGGVYLPALRLWLDPHEPQAGSDVVFVSHAHSDHTADHRAVILTASTARLMQVRLGGPRVEHVLPFGESREFSTGERSFRLTLLPAGHIFGSAMALVEAEGGSLLYTGDFKLRRGLSAEACEPRHAEVLIMETTYGRPHYQFPPEDAVLRGLVRFCSDALDNDETPVLLGYALGKSQELLRGLAGAGLPIMLHGSVHRLTTVYEQLGQKFPPYEPYDARTARGKVLVCPPQVAGSAMLRNLGRVRSAVLTGWALDPECRFRYQADAAFPLSDHADFNELIQLVQAVAPKRVYTLHGFAADFAQTLRGLGFEARALSENEQLALPMEMPCRDAVSRPRDRPLLPSHSEPITGGQAVGAFVDRFSFLEFARNCAAIRAHSSKLEKVRLLAEYLRLVAPAGLATVTVWFTGSPFAASENRVMQVGWAVLRDAVCAITGASEADFHHVYLQHSDLGETASDLMSAHLARTGETAAPVATGWPAPEARTAAGLTPLLTIEEVAQAFGKLQQARGPLAKLPVLTQLLEKCTPIEAKFIFKIITGDLRIGLKEGLVEDALAQAFNVPPDEVRQANLLLGHIGRTAVLSQQNALHSAELTPFRAVKFMLASPEPTAGDIWKRMTGDGVAPDSRGCAGEHAAKLDASGDIDVQKEAPCSHLRSQVWLEDKYDGVRCQLHKVGERVVLYSRDLKDITATFSEIAAAARGLRSDVILDGEVLAMSGDRVLPFSELQKRLGRHEADLFLGREIPVAYVAFDLLWREGENLLRQPLARRRAILESLQPRPALLRLARITPAHSEEEIEAAFAAARARGNEGLMVKDPNSVYSPGRRGLAWLKLKKALATLDCVVVGAEYGHGKRKSVLSDYTFAVRDDRSGELKTIGKAYSGLTDEEIARLTRHFLSRALRQHGRYYEVEPEVVLEIAFDRLQPSDRHTSGLAMRFPRIVRIRTDKSLADIDTVASARKLVPVFPG